MKANEKKANEKQLPHNMDAEIGVLSSVLINPDSLSRVADFLRPEDFYREKHRLVYEAMLTLDSRREAIDYVTISDELEIQGKLDAVGQPYVISDLVNFEISSSHIEYYARIVQKNKQLRDAIKIATEMVANAYERNEDTINIASAALYRLEQGQRVERLAPIQDALDRFMTKFDAIYDARKKSVVSGIPTGFKSLDQVLGGFQPSDLLILAARPAVGKTSLGLNLAEHIMGNSKRDGRNVLLFSLEMGEEQLVRRLLSMVTGIDQTRIRNGDIVDEEWQLMVDAHEKLSHGKMWLDDTAGISIQDMRSRARRVQSEHGLDLIIVDYMQLMSTSDKHENRNQEVSAISRGLKGLARELNVPVLALAQLSRAVEQRSDKVPQLSDLRESGSIEQDADVVMFIHHDESIPTTDKGYILNIMISKHRNGPTGIVPLMFNPTLTRFHEVEQYLTEEE